MGAFDMGYFVIKVLSTKLQTDEELLDVIYLGRSLRVISRWQGALYTTEYDAVTLEPTGEYSVQKEDDNGRAVSE